MLFVFVIYAFCSVLDAGSGRKRGEASRGGYFAKRSESRLVKLFLLFSLTIFSVFVFFLLFKIVFLYK